MVSNMDSVRDFLRLHVHPGKYTPDLKEEGHVLAYRLDHGEFPVIYTTAGMHYPLGAANFVGKHLRGRQALFLVFFTWASDDPSAVNRSRKAVSVYNYRRPEHRFIFLCNTEAERAAHAAAGLEAVLCNDNAFVDEEVFTPRPGTLRYDAVYNAAMAGWKRHELASLVGTCVHLTYKRADVSAEDTIALVAHLRKTMPGHVFANPMVGADIESFPPERVAEVLRQARCGLCLSAVEGAMWASIEYLLTGLPVVSTRSKGGRDEFADPEHWITVDDTPEAVAAGVRELIERRLRPEDVRASALARVYRHRAKLRETVARATNGVVDLPDRLDDSAYRFITGSALRWPRAADLPATLALLPA